MTLITFGVAGFFAWLHFTFLGRVIMPGLTVWVAWYAAVLFSLIVLAVRRGDAAMRAGAAIMLASFAAAHLIWNASAWPIATHSLKNIAVASALVLAALAFSSRTLLIAAGLHLALVAIGAATDLGLILTGKRPLQFIAFAFPDVSAGFQHAALIILSFGAARSQAVDLGCDHRSGHSGGLAAAFGLALPRAPRNPAPPQGQ